MSIANELCSEVATAVLTRQDNRGKRETKEMTRILLEVYATLRRLHADERRKPFQHLNTTVPPLPNVNVASSNR